MNWLSSSQRVAGILTCAALVAAGCVQPVEPAASSQEALVELPEYLSWWTIVFDDEQIRDDELPVYEQRLRDTGATDVIFLAEIGVAFARFDDATNLASLDDVVGVYAADRATTYTPSGVPSLDELRAGNFDLEALEGRRASRRPHRGNPGGRRGRAPRQPTEDDLLYESDWGLHRINAPEAWRRTTGSHRTVVAVIDTGVATNHPDLTDNVVHHACFHFSSMTTGEPCNPYPTFTHGTHVAGTIAAQFGGGEAVGVGPNLGIASYNVFEPLLLHDYDIDGDGDSGTLYYPLTTDVQILGALLDAIERGYSVVNMSLGGAALTGTDYANASLAAWDRAVALANRRGTTIVVAAGNEADAVDQDGEVIGDLDGEKYIIVPAELDGVITVAATGFRLDEDGQPYDIQAYYSNYGERIDLSAPGGDYGGQFDASIHGITSTEMMVDSLDDSIFAELLDIEFEENPCIGSQSCEVGYVSFQGTSMASPHVAGVVGLMRDRHRCRRRSGGFEWVRERLTRTAQPGPQGFPFGAGIVDAEAAVR